MRESSGDGSALSPGLMGSLTGRWCPQPAPGGWRFSHFQWGVTGCPLPWASPERFEPLSCLFIALEILQERSQILFLLLNKQYLWFPSYSIKLYKIRKNKRKNNKKLPHDQPTKVLWKGTLAVCLSDMIPNLLFNCQCVPIKGDLFFNHHHHRIIE